MDCNYPIPFVLIKARFQGYNRETLHAQIQQVPGIKKCSEGSTYRLTEGAFVDIQLEMNPDEKQTQAIGALSPLCTLISKLNPESSNCYRIAGYFVPHVNKIFLALQNKTELVDHDQFSILSAFRERYYVSREMRLPENMGRVEATERDVFIPEDEASCVVTS